MNRQSRASGRGRHDLRLDPDAVIDAAWPVDGPYNAERTVTAARAAGELVRYLAYATRPASGLPEPADVYDLVGAVRVLLDRLPQTLVQTGDRFAVLAAAPGARLTDPAHPGDPQAPAAAAATVRGGLDAAARTLAEVSARLNAAHTQAGRLYLTGGQATGAETGSSGADLLDGGAG